MGSSNRVLIRFIVGLCFLTSLYTTVKAVNGGIINIDLSSLNASSHEAIKVKTILHGSAQIHLHNVGMVGFFVIQVHSFESPVYLARSNVSEDLPGVNGTNIGLVEIWTSTEYDYVIEGSKFDNITILLVIIGYDMKAPIPGGCNLTFETEDAPYQIISYSDALIRVDAQPPRLQDYPCSTIPIGVDVFHLYLDQQNFSSDEYFGAIEKMLTPESIRKYGRKVEKPDNLPDTKRYFSLYQGVGTVYAMVANFEGNISAYIPAVSYACNFTENVDTCSGPLTTSWKIICGLMVFYGLFMCLWGHRCFQINLFCMGFFVAAVITFVFISYSNLSEGEAWITLGIMGVLYGSFWLLVWWKFKIPILSVMLNYFVAGFLVAGIFFYVGPADTNMFRNDINYWSVLIGISLLVHLVLLIISHWPSNIIATSFIGSYIFLIPFDLYVGGSLRYLFINVIRRATISNFNLAIIDPPYLAAELKFFIVIWALVALLGIYVQFRQNWGRAPFPPPPTVIRDDFVRSVPNERSPLLADNVDVIVHH